MPNKRIDQLTPNNQPIDGSELIPLYNVNNNSTRRAPINDVATFISNNTDTYVTGATLNVATLEINRNNGEPQINVDLSSLTGGTSTDTYVTGATLTGTTLEINQNNGQPQVTVDLSPLNSGPTKTYIARILNVGLGFAPIVQAEIVNEGFTQAFQIPINNAPNNGRILINSLLGEFTTDKTFVTAFIVNNDPVTGYPGAVVSSSLLGFASVQLDMFDASGARQDFLEVLVKIEVYP